MDTTGTDTLSASMAVPMTVCYIQRDIAYTMHKSMIVPYFLAAAAASNADLNSFEYVHRHSVGLCVCV